MFFTTFPVGWLQCNCAIVADDDTRHALVIDPGDEAERILDVCRGEGLDVVALLHTHAHIDHVSGTRRVHEATLAPVRLHAGDAFLYRNLAMQAAWLGIRADAVAPLGARLEHGEIVRAGSLSVEVVHTPGHTPGSVCFAIQAGPKGKPLLLSGDTLFYRGIGRTDLWGGDMDAIVRSLQERVYALPADTEVLPGHGPWTTIGAEARGNPFVTAR